MITNQKLVLRFYIYIYIIKRKSSYIHDIIIGIIFTLHEYTYP